MTVIFYLVAIFFFALLIGFAGKVIIGGLMGAKPEMFRFARKGSIGNQLFNTIYLVFISYLSPCWYPSPSVSAPEFIWPCMRNREK